MFVVVPSIVLLIGAPSRRTDPFTGMPFALIPSGSFQMGTPDTEPRREAQEHLHPVTLTRSFYIGVHEVTQREWTRVMGTTPSNFKDCPRCPVERVSHVDVERFLARLNGVSSWPGLRLPNGNTRAVLEATSGNGRATITAPIRMAVSAILLRVVGPG